MQLACWLQECPPELLPRELNANVSTISCLQRCFREFGSTSNRPHNHKPCVTTPAQDLHIQHLHLQDRLRPATQTAAATIGLHNQIISAQTVWNCPREPHLDARHPHRVSNWLQFIIITDLSGQMLTFDGVWHFREVFSSRMNPNFHCTGQMADSVYGVVWVSGLLMSTFWIKRPMVGLWYGQAYVMDNEYRCILLMEFWMHRDTVTRSWGPLLCHSSTTITSCCSMIMHGTMLQGSVHNSWKLKTSQFLHGQHTHTGHVTHWGCLGCSGSAYTTACSSSCQYPAISHSHWRGVDQHATGHNQQPDQLYAEEMCCTVWGILWSHQILTGFRTPPPTPQYSKTAHFRVAFYCGQPKAHLNNNHAV